MARKPKILVGSPQSDKKNYCFDDWYNLVQNLTYRNKSLFLADNSENRGNDKLLHSLGIKNKYINPQFTPEIQFALAQSHEAVRRHALDNDFDYLLHLETDVFPPVNVIELLLMHNKSVVGASYPVGFGEDRHIMAQVKENFGDHRVTSNIGIADISLMNPELQEVFSCGLGCVLIKRDVLKRIKFRYEAGATIYPDSFFFADLDSLGIPVYLDTDIICDHRNNPFTHHLTT